MSLTEFSAGAPLAQGGHSLPKVTMPALSEMKRQGKPISALTAYDYATARLVDEAGIDLILVGDSLAMVVLGHENTLAITVDEMLHHTRAVRRGVHRALVVADMPFGSYHGTIGEGVANAVRFLKEAGAEAVKIEGPRVELVRALVAAEVPVVGHLGLTPQSVHRMGGYRVQARSIDSVLQLQADAFALATAGAGPDCDGQILVFHDLVNLTFAPPAKFVRRYGDASALIHSAVERYREDVEHHAFPSDAESYHLPESARRLFAIDPDATAAREDADAVVNPDTVVNIDAREEMNEEVNRA